MGALSIPVSGKTDQILNWMQKETNAENCIDNEHNAGTDDDDGWPNCGRRAASLQTVQTDNFRRHPDDFIHKFNVALLVSTSRRSLFGCT